MTSDFAHDHNFLGQSHDVRERRTRFVVALTAVMMVIENAAGRTTGELQLLLPTQFRHAQTLRSFIEIAAASVGSGISPVER